MIGGLGQAEVDDLGHGLAVDLGHQDVRGLQVAVDDGLLVGVLHAVADLGEQLQPRRGAQPLAVAVAGDGFAFDVLHDEEGAAPGGRAGVEDPGDAGVVHHGQGLPLGVEAGDHPAGVHAQLDDLQGDAPAQGLGLLGLEDLAHAALAQAAHQAVGADDRADVLVRGAAAGFADGQGVVVFGAQGQGAVVAHAGLRSGLGVSVGISQKGE